MSPLVWFLIGLFAGVLLCACVLIWLRLIAALDHVELPMATTARAFDRNFVIYCVVVLVAVLTIAFVLSTLILEAD